MSDKFRLHPEPGTERTAIFNPIRAVYKTVRDGGFGSALLIPHIVLPIYGIYVISHRSSYWSPEYEKGLAFAIALIQGVSFGTAIALSLVRYSPAGKAIKGRRIEKTATREEASKQYRLEVTLRLAAYLFLGTILWEYLVHSKYSPVASKEARQTTSGFLTATGALRRFLNEESLMHEAGEGRAGVAGVGLNFDVKENIKNLRDAIEKGPRIRVPIPAPKKSIFFEKIEETRERLLNGRDPGLDIKWNFWK
ncbi:hypothetical protein PSEUBRA_004171 [Kalmanozyma brasiliensis GHG001]|uniref:Uncharacterized protein n=1 Tax=Kalmanozyma brasiliensis (strain GHG001) TaxID=1365824 RepID=V5E7K6_KALBG|nr:uncharacterized protein PSEUBRA_004171 [Kalmanozyma brasiliensis GHG001]EST06286.1 hypothetical protein PSEUBRA_004171 [Kalmanozyma brasiliensis GHG001]